MLESKNIKILLIIVVLAIVILVNILYLISAVLSSRSLPEECDEELKTSIADNLVAEGSFVIIKNINEYTLENKSIKIGLHETFSYYPDGYCLDSYQLTDIINNTMIVRFLKGCEGNAIICDIKVPK